MACSCSPIATPRVSARSRSTCIRFVSRHANCGASRRQPNDTVVVDLWDDYLELVSPECGLIRCGIKALAVLPRLPRDEGGPVFAEPWQAQAFALAVNLSEQAFHVEGMGRRVGR